MNAYRAILAKDLRVELRTLESIPAMVLFAATTFVLFRFGLDRESLSGRLAAGVLLATVLFAAILADQPGLRRRARAGRLRPDPARARRRHLALRSPRRRSCSSTWRRSSSSPCRCSRSCSSTTPAGSQPLAAVLALVNLGLAAIGALVSSIAVNSRARDLIAPLLLLPLLVPVMIGAGGAAEPLLAAGGPSYADFGKWMAILALYDVVFCLVGYAVYDFVLED